MKNDDLNQMIEKLGKSLKDSGHIGLAVNIPTEQDKNGGTKYTFSYRNTSDVSEMLAYLMAEFTREENCSPSAFLLETVIRFVTFPGCEHIKNDKALSDFLAIITQRFGNEPCIKH